MGESPLLIKELEEVGLGPTTIIDNVPGQITRSSSVDTFDTTQSVSIELARNFKKVF
jgi:hypothetical protein